MNRVLLFWAVGLGLFSACGDASTEALSAADVGADVMDATARGTADAAVDAMGSMDLGTAEDDASVDASAPPRTALPTGLHLVSLMAGAFSMGGPGADGPVHEVTLSAFALGETEVTNAQYVEFLNAAYAAGAVSVERRARGMPGGMTNDQYVIGAPEARHAGSAYVQLSAEGGTTHQGDPEHAFNRSYIDFDGALFRLVDEARGDWPVNWVKWHGADAFAAWYDARLPTEAEWEYAAGVGGTIEFATVDGAVDQDLANYNGDRPAVYDPDGHVVAVKTYAPNAWGLYEMSGNVWEWCDDWYDPDYYQTGPAMDPRNIEGMDPETARGSARENPVAGMYRVRRGGSWNYHTATLAVTARAFDFAERGNNHFGFRIARDLSD